VLIQGKELMDLVVTSPLTGQALRTLVYNEITSSYGTGVMPVIPGHDLESLRIASHYDIDKAGCLDA